MLTKITAAILLLALFGIVWTSDAIDGANASVGIGAPGQAPALQLALNSGALIMNESSYKSFLGMVQGMYREDFNYSGGILENYVNKTISDRDAMVATTSVFILTSHSIALLETNRPPKIYENTYNNTLLGMTYLRAFLWNMSKFYETNKNFYLVQARKNLNDSVSYYKTGQEELASPKA
jgi:hypothetical protein